jgi:hypothetical protein
MVSSEVDHRCGNRGIGNGELFRAGYPCARKQSQHRGNKPAISHFVLPCSGVFRSARDINERIAGFSNCIQNGCDLRHPPKAPLVQVSIEILDCLPVMHGTEPSYRRGAQRNIARLRRQGQAPTLESSLSFRCACIYRPFCFRAILRSRALCRIAVIILPIGVAFAGLIRFWHNGPWQPVSRS